MKKAKILILQIIQIHKVLQEGTSHRESSYKENRLGRKQHFKLIEYMALDTPFPGPK